MALFRTSAVHSHVEGGGHLGMHRTLQSARWGARLAVRTRCVPNALRSVPCRRLLSTQPPADEPAAETTAAKDAQPAAAVGDATRMEFQAETKKLLDIVARSLYTDKEVFVRELVSNASDALEKRRYEMVTAGAAGDDEADLGITITTDKEANTLTIADTGIGMSREELVQNLGTIARSGTKAFAQQLAEAGSGGDAAANVIGQFGVGFYAVFMVAEHVTVFSRRHGEGEVAHCWSSSGDGAYDLAEAEGVPAGTRIVLKLKDDESHFASRFHIEQNIRKYSNFVGFPINVDGERINTIEAIWLKQKNEVSTEQHNEFFRYVAQSFDDPRYTMHFAADAPVSIRALFYVPHSHMEKWGMARQDCGVHLYWCVPGCGGDHTTRPTRDPAVADAIFVTRHACACASAPCLLASPMQSQGAHPVQVRESAA